MAKRYFFDFDTPPAEELAFRAYEAEMVEKYGPKMLVTADFPFTADEVAKIERLEADVAAAHQRAFLAHQRAKLDARLACYR